MKNILEKLFKIEDKYKLLDLKIDEIYIWQYLRGEIFDLIRNANVKVKLEVMEKVNIKLFTKIIELTKNSLLYNPFFTFKKYNKIVFLHNRKNLINNSFVDVYTDSFIDDNTLVIDSSYDEVFQTKYKRNSFINLSMFILRLFIKTDSDSDKIHIIENIISEELNVKINLIKIFKKHLGTFKAFYKIYNLLFRYIKPKEIVIVVSYGQSALIKAAKDNGIKVIEVQHGNIHKYHFGYSFGGRKNIEYFPDILYVFGEYFKKLNYLPLLEQNIKVHEYPFFKYKLKKYRNYKKDENVITIISEAEVWGGDLQYFILNNIEFLKNYKVYYKLHPQELENQLAGYKELTTKIVNLSFIEVIGTEYDLYELLLNSKYIISPVSTVIFEALELSCNVIVPKVGFWNTLEEIENKILLLDVNEKLNYKDVNIYFEKMETYPKGYFIKSLKEN